MIRTSLSAVAAAVSLSLPCLAQNPGAERLASVEIRAERVADDLYVLFGAGGNIAVSLGAQGVLIVDSQFPELVPKIRAAIEQLGGRDIDFAINTHWHYDHADGNQRLGPEGVWFISHAESRRRMTIDNVIDPMSRPAFPQPAYPPAALPVATFDTRMQFHFNDQLVDLMHFGPAHTAGDAAVFFRNRNAVHMGDLFMPRGYPFVDVDNGGDIDGLIAFCRGVLAELDENSIVIPGHGPIATYADLAHFTDMLETVRARIAELMRAGADLEQILAAKPTAPFDERYGMPANFVDRVHTSLSR
jgi:cyclase